MNNLTEELKKLEEKHRKEREAAIAKVTGPLKEERDKIIARLTEIDRELSTYDNVVGAVSKKKAGKASSPKTGVVTAPAVSDDKWLSVMTAALTDNPSMTRQELFEFTKEKLHEQGLGKRGNYSSKFDRLLSQGNQFHVEGDRVALAKA